MTHLKLFGLTGGIASGKSTVSSYLRERGVDVIDADALYHGLVAPQRGRPSPLAAAIEAALGDVLKPDGSLDRARLGARVFGDAKTRRLLEQITHPAVHEQMQHCRHELERAGKLLCFYDVPLLIERNLGPQMDGTLLVWVPKEVQLQRLCQRNALSVQDAQARLAAQMPLDEKRKFATWVVDNAADRAHTYRQVDAVLQKLRVE